MVVAHGEVVHGAHHDLAVFDHGAVFGGVHAQDGALRRVDDGGGHHGAEGAAVADGEGAAGHLFHTQLALRGFLAVIGDLLLDLGKAHLISVAQNGHHQAARRTDGDADVKVAVVDDVVAIHRRVEHREFFQRMHRRFDKEAHEAELDAMLFLKTLLEALAHFHDRGHVDLVEGGEDGVARLRLQQALGHAGAQPGHGHALFGALAKVWRGRRVDRRQGAGRDASGNRYRLCGSSRCGRSQHIAFGDAAVFAGADDGASGHAFIGHELGSSRHGHTGHRACGGGCSGSGGSWRGNSRGCDRRGGSADASRINAGDELLGHDGSAVCDQDLCEHARRGRGDFKHDFVGFDLDQDLVGGDHVTGLLFPLQHGGLGHRFGELGDFDFNDSHGVSFGMSGCLGVWVVRSR